MGLLGSAVCALSITSASPSACALDFLSPVSQKPHWTGNEPAGWLAVSLKLVIGLEFIFKIRS